MAKDWVRALGEVDKIKNYSINFYQGEDVQVTAKDAAKVKFAILNDIRCFEIGDSLYATKNVAGVVRGSSGPWWVKNEVDYDELSPPPEQLKAAEVYQASLSMNSYLNQQGKLLDKPQILLT